MYWILAAVFLAIALMVPRLRPVAIAGGVILAVLLAWGMAQRLGDPKDSRALPERTRPGSPAMTRQPLPLTQVAVGNLQLLGSGAPFELRGRVTNNSATALIRAVTIKVTRRDCFEGAPDPGGCVVLWQDNHQVVIAVQPGLSRDFSVAIWLRGAALKARGTVQDAFEVVAAVGEPGKKQAK